MSDLGGAIMLSQQLSLYRTLDSFNQARDHNRAVAHDAAWRNQYDNLVNQYNRLLNDANRLADVHDKERALKDREIAELRAANKAHESGAKVAAAELAYAKDSLKMLRGLVKQLYPDIYQDDGQND